jgi:glycosyltransferase involved in cell wall biosynthesis
MATPSTLLHVVQISFFSDPAGRLPKVLLEVWPSLVDVADAACRAGVRVSVVQASSHSERFERNGVRYYFLPFGAALPEVRQSAAFGELLRHLAPDVLHVHGLGFLKDVVSLAAMAPDIPIALQDHANRAPRFWRRASWRRGLSVASGITFCALQQARPFVDAGLIGPHTKLYGIPESTSRFTPGDQAEARRVTRVGGDPAVLWVGNLDANKDPLTILDGISDAARTLPRLQLYCCFGAAPLLRVVQERIASDPLLCERVHLLGRVPHARVEELMRAADVFVLGSHHEGSGFSLIEALACGLPPVVTDIPSFRSLTAAGTIGMLWPCDDARAMGTALQSVVSRSGAQMRAAVRAHFDRELSFDALGLHLAQMYQDLLERSASSAASRNPPHPYRAARGV